VADSAWIALSLTDHIGSKKLRALSQHFGGDLRAALNADSQTLQEVPGIGPKIASTIRAIDLAQVEQSLAQWESAGVEVVTDCPGRLAVMDDAPATLFVRGVKLNDIMLLEKSVAIVGTREPGDHSLALAWKFGFELAQCGYLVVSGLALGIDTAAHQGALKAANGLTAAVLGSGLLNIYPPQNSELAERIMRRGALLSEVHPLAETSASKLVARNRIISGLCDSLIVVETEADGGAMHAARFARMQGRRIFTTDHPSSGNQALISAGAVILDSDLDRWFP